MWSKNIFLSGAEGGGGGGGGCVQSTCFIYFKKYFLEKYSF